MKNEYQVSFATYEEMRVAANASDAFAKVWDLAAKGVSFCKFNDVPDEIKEWFYAIQDTLTEAGFE